MLKKISIHQPLFFPYLGFWNKLLKSDLMFILSDVKPSSSDFVHRNYILNREGARLRIGFPFPAGSQTIRDMKFDNKTSDVKWRCRDVQNIIYSYYKAEEFSFMFKTLLKCYGLPHLSVADYNLSCIRHVHELIHPDLSGQTIVTTHNVRRDKLNDATEMLIRIINFFRADIYLSGSFGRDYLDLKQFDDAGIEIFFQDYQHPEYEQINTTHFVPNLSIIDLLANKGRDASEIIMSGDHWIDTDGNKVEI